MTDYSLIPLDSSGRVHCWDPSPEHRQYWPPRRKHGVCLLCKWYLDNRVAETSPHSYEDLARMATEVYRVNDRLRKIGGSS